MFWSRKQATVEAGSAAEQVGLTAEGFYRSGKMHCAEAVLAAARSAFFPDVPEEVIRAAAGFGGGSGAGCLCGAVAGGTMAFGLALQDDKRRLTALTRDLHSWFAREYGATCCRVAMKNAKEGGGCAVLTGRVAEKVAELMQAG